MANATSNRPGLYSPQWLLMRAPLAANTKIPKGCLAALNTSQKAVNWADTLNFRPLGVAKEMYDNTNGADDAIIGEFYREGRFEFTAVGASSAWLGSLVYATDNQTVQTTATANMPAIGRVVEVISATRVVVDVHLR